MSSHFPSREHGIEVVTWIIDEEYDVDPSVGIVQTEVPRIRLQRSDGWRALNLREIWQYRELLYFLSWRDIKVRYKQTLLGVLWAIIQPFFTMVVFSIFFWQARQDTIGRNSVPDFRFRSARALDFVRQRSYSVFQQSGPKRESAQESLFSTTHHTNLECACRYGGLPAGVYPPVGDDAVLRYPSHRKHRMVAVLSSADMWNGLGSGIVALGHEREV